VQEKLFQKYTFFPFSCLPVQLKVPPDAFSQEHLVDLEQVVESSKVQKRE
jgi:hypothetical protein